MTSTKPQTWEYAACQLKHPRFEAPARTFGHRGSPAAWSQVASSCNARSANRCKNEKKSQNILDTYRMSYFPVFKINIMNHIP